jgi:hypothetical protein
LASIQVELGAGVARHQQAVRRIDPDAVLGALAVEAQDLPAPGVELTRQVGFAAGGEVGVRGLEEPKGRVDRVVLGDLAAVGEAVRDEAAPRVSEEGPDDLARGVEPAARQQEAGERDHGAPAPPVNQG